MRLNIFVLYRDITLHMSKLRVIITLNNVNNNVTEFPYHFYDT